MDEQAHEVRLEQLRRRLDRARRRAADATQGGPEWDAAMAEFDDVQQQLEELASRVGARVTVAIA